MPDRKRDELFDDAVRVVLETRSVSVSLLQRRLTIGYARASRLIKKMIAGGVVAVKYERTPVHHPAITLKEWDASRARTGQDHAGKQSPLQRALDQISKARDTINQASAVFQSLRDEAMAATNQAMQHIEQALKEC